MERRLSREWSDWVESVGGINVATQKIMQRLECSSSKAEKLAARRYPSRLTASEERALAKMLGKPREVVFAGETIAS